MGISNILISCFLINFGYLIDMPSTYVLNRGSYDLTVRLEPDGGMIGHITVSPFDNFMFGMSYGGKHIIGYGTPDWNASPEFQAKLGISTPMISFAIGFDSQVYMDSALGLYGVLGGNLGGKVIPYLGVGYRSKTQFFLGTEVGLARGFSFLAEGLLKNKFILNVGLRWVFADRIILEFDLKDVTGKQIGRILKFSYTDYI